MLYQLNDNDCLQTTFANFFNVDRNAITPFHEYFEQDNSNWFGHIEWYLDKDYNLIVLPVHMENGIIVGFESNKTLVNFKCIALLKKADRNFSHAVMLNVTRDQIEMFDPKPDSDYTLDDISKIWLIFKKDVV